MIVQQNNRTEKQVITAQTFVMGNSSQRSGDIDNRRPVIVEGILMCTCLKGSADFLLNHKEFSLSAGQILIILPNQILRKRNSTEDFFCEILFFPVDFLADYPSPLNLDILIRIAENPLIAVPDEAMQSILDMLSLIIRHYEDQKNAYRDQIIKTLLFALLLEAGSVYVKARPERVITTKTRQEELTEKFFKLLLKHFRQERSVAFYADKLCLTPKYLSTVIRNNSGRCALEWINEVVIIEAKKQLRSTNLTVLQISEELHFPNPSFFGRFFKQHTGLTPLQYRDGI